MRRTRPSWLTWRGRSRDEKGAIAVIVAIMAVLLFASAAIAVDLGNLTTKYRTIREVVDIAQAQGMRKVGYVATRERPN